MLALIIFVTIGAHWLSTHDPNAILSPETSRYQPPSAEHYFGTDKFGRDVYSRVLYGGRVTIAVALSVVIMALTIGSAVGAVSGYLGGVIDILLMRLLDVLLAFPIVFLAVTCIAIFGMGLWSLIWILALTSWMDIARLVRAEVLSLKKQSFVIRARASGLGTIRIIFRHLLPNVFSVVLTVAVLRIADIILVESALSFLGFGVRPPQASWGTLINDGFLVRESAWWLTVFPGLAIILTTLCLNLIGEALKSNTR